MSKDLEYLDGDLLVLTVVEMLLVLLMYFKDVILLGHNEIMK